MRASAVGDRLTMASLRNARQGIVESAPTFAALPFLAANRRGNPNLCGTVYRTALACLTVGHMSVFPAARNGRPPAYQPPAYRLGVAHEPWTPAAVVRGDDAMTRCRPAIGRLSAPDHQPTLPLVHGHREGLTAFSTALSRAVCCLARRRLSLRRRQSALATRTRNATISAIVTMPPNVSPTAMVMMRPTLPGAGRVGRLRAACRPSPEAPSRSLRFYRVVPRLVDARDGWRW